MHELFDLQRVNRVNPRKEFFRVPLDELEAIVRKHHGEFKLTKLAEAIEYRKILALIEEARRSSPGESTIHPEAIEGAN